MARRQFDVSAVITGRLHADGGWEIAAEGAAPELPASIVPLLDRISASPRVLTLEDVASDPSLAGDGLLPGGADLRFCAGVALRARHARSFGAVLLLDPRPRTLGDRERALLSDLGALLASSLEAQRVAEQEAYELNRLQHAFLANMSHEIRTPLTSILGFAEMMANQADDPLRQFAGLIRKNGERLLSTLDDVLELARLESRLQLPELKRIDLAACAREAGRTHRSRARARGLDLVVAGTDAPAWVHADPSTLARVIDHLLANAVKFTQEGRIVVDVQTDESHAVLRVTDTGVGISQGFLPYVFDGFRQESTGIARDFEGSGLGLTLVKRLIEVMGGAVSLESEKGRGSSFAIRLPAAPSTPVEAADRASRPGAAGPAAVSARPRVLVVEDNEASVVLLQHLTPPVYDLTIATTAEQGLARARASIYDIVLLDIDLGHGQSGRDLMRTLRHLPAYASAPIVAVTALALPDDRDALLAEGFDGYLAKPFDQRQLLQILELSRHLGGRTPDTRVGSLDTLLSSCLQHGLIERYAFEREHDVLTLERQGATFRLAYPRAARALHGLLSDA